jgi:hypothetical protein
LLGVVLNAVDSSAPDYYYSYRYYPYSYGYGPHETSDSSHNGDISAQPEEEGAVFEASGRERRRRRDSSDDDIQETL